MRIRTNGGQTGRAFLIEGLVSRRSPIVLNQNVVTDCIDEGAKTLGLAKGARLFQAGQDPGEGFLAHVLNSLGGPQPGAKLQLEQSGEITDKMLLSAGIPGTEIFDVSCIERMKFQSRPR